MNLPPRRILLADDDQEVRVGVAELLGGLGLEVLEAEDGGEALALVRAEVVHAALLDMYMPGGPGLALLPRLWELRRGLPCILYSGRWSPALRDEVLRAGALACLKKPVDPALLRDEVLRALAFPGGIEPLTN